MTSRHPADVTVVRHRMVYQVMLAASIAICFAASGAAAIIAMAFVPVGLAERHWGLVALTGAAAPFLSWLTVALAVAGDVATSARVEMDCRAMRMVIPPGAVRWPTPPRCMVFSGCRDITVDYADIELVRFRDGRAGVPWVQLELGGAREVFRIHLLHGYLDLTKLVAELEARVPDKLDRAERPAW